MQQALLLNGLDEALVNLLLVLSPCRADLLLLGALALLLGEEALLAALLVGLAVAGEVLGLANLLDGALVDAVDRDVGGGSDDVAGVDTAERDTVDLEWAGDEERTLVEDLEEHNTLATEAASKEDQDGARLEGGARLVWAEGLADL